MKSLKALLVNLKTYYLMTFRNTFLVIAHYLLPVLFYLLFSVVFVGINEENKRTIIMSMTAFGLAMNSYIGLPGALCVMPSVISKEHTSLAGSNYGMSLSVPPSAIWSIAL